MHPGATRPKLSQNVLVLPRGSLDGRLPARMSALVIRFVRALFLLALACGQNLTQDPLLTYCYDVAMHPSGLYALAVGDLAN